MPFAEDVIKGVERLAFSRYRNPSDMSVKIKVSQPIISKLLARKSNPRMDILGRLLDALGARIVFPDEQRSTVRKAVVAAHGNMPDGERIPGNFNVVPMVSPGALRPGGVLPGEAVGWFVLNMDTVALRGRESIVGTVLERHHDALLPLVGPGDTAFVDTADRGVGAEPAVFAVRSPKGESVDFRRVTVGFAVDAERPEAGGTGELYLWGAFTLMENTECSHGCVDCRAG